MPSIAQPATNGRGQLPSACNPVVDLYELLWAEPGNNPARPVLMAALHLDANTADFLAACIYWSLVMSGPFWKFNEPPAKATPHYRTGDSWLEELGIGEKALYRARSTVATKNVTDNDLSATLARTDTSTLVIYWTKDEEGTRLTWYDVRLDLVCQKLSQALGLTIVANQRPPQVRRTLSNALSAQAEPARTTTRAYSTPEEAPLRLPAAATPTLAPTEGGFPMKVAPEGVTYHPYKEKEEAENESEGEKAVIHKIAETLQGQPVTTARGGEARFVEPGPAWAIAERVYAHSLDVAAALAIFESHLAELRATKRDKPAVDLVRMLVTRMKTWRLERRPDPTPLNPTLAWYLAEIETMREPVPPMVSREGAWLLNAEETHELVDRPELTPPGTELEETDADPQQQLWQAVLNDLQLQMTRATFDTWLRSTRLIAVQDGIYTILAHPNALAWLENRLHRQIEHTLERHVGQPIALEFTTSAELVP